MPLYLRLLALAKMLEAIGDTYLVNANNKAGQVETITCIGTSKMYASSINKIFNILVRTSNFAVRVHQARFFIHVFVLGQLTC